MKYLQFWQKKTPLKTPEENFKLTVDQLIKAINSSNQKEIPNILKEIENYDKQIKYPSFKTIFEERLKGMGRKEQIKLISNLRKCTSRHPTINYMLKELFTIGIIKGDIEIVNQVIENAPRGVIMKLIESLNNSGDYSLGLAGRRGHIVVLDKILKLAPPAMVNDISRHACRGAIGGNQPTVLNRVLSQMSPPKRQELFTQNNFSFFGLVGIINERSKKLAETRITLLAYCDEQCLKKMLPYLQNSFQNSIKKFWYTSQDFFEKQGLNNIVEDYYDENSLLRRRIEAKREEIRQELRLREMEVALPALSEGNILIKDLRRLVAEYSGINPQDVARLESMAGKEPQAAGSTTSSMSSSLCSTPGRQNHLSSSSPLTGVAVSQNNNVLDDLAQGIVRDRAVKDDGKETFTKKLDSGSAQEQSWAEWVKSWIVKGPEQGNARM
jgi:hypothetical protein